MGPRLFLMWRRSLCLLPLKLKKTRMDLPIETRGNIDEAMMSIAEMVSFFFESFEEITDEEEGVVMGIEKICLDMPVQLDVVLNQDGSVNVGTAPPLYRIDTSFSPIFHQLKFTMERI